ncbi:MAG: PKD domain-containing protein [Bacteroidia bacterium]
MNLKIFLTSCAVLISLLGKAQSTCHAAFTYTVGTGGQVTFADSSSGTNANTSYSWGFGDSQWSGQQNPGTITYAYNGTYNVSLWIMDSVANCNDSYSAQVTVNTAAPCNLQAAFTYTVDTSGYVHFTNTTANANIYTNYFWQLQGVHDSVGNNSAFTIHYIYNGSYIVNVSANNSNGVCSSYFSDTIVVTTGITCNLVPSFTTSAGSNGLVNFSNTSTGMAPGSLTYWDFGYGANSYQANPSYTFQYNGNYVVTMNISDSTGFCSGSLLDTVRVTNASPCPFVQAAFADSIGNNGYVFFQNNSTGIDTGSYFIWDQGDGNSFIDTSVTHSHTYNVNGTYIVSLTVANRHNPCLSAAFTDTIVITNSNNCIPTVSFSMVKDTANPGVWSAVANYSSNVVNAIWYWGDGTSDAGYSPTHNYASAGMYNICVLVMSACNDSAMACQNDSLYRNSSMISVSVINTNGVGIADHSSPDHAINLFPNPTRSGEFSITNIKASDVIRVTNIYGQEVNAEITKQNNSASARIETAGAYFVTINSKGRITTLKVIVSKE